jgi:ketosteroid isomerase-like protein
MLAARVRAAMESADLTAMAELLAPDARWGAPEQDVPTCRSAKDVLAWYELARDNGLRANVIEMTIVDDTIVVGLHIIATGDETSRPDDSPRWQVLSIRDGRVAEIRGYETRGEATEFATSGVSVWSDA